MLSRLALRSVTSPKPSAALCWTRSTQTTAPLNAEESERDLVNFPRRKRAINAPKTRIGFLPDEWFTAFYNKTGVTGPYMLGVGVMTFLLSKEIYVIEHEFYNAVSIFGCLALGIQKLGPGVGAALDKDVDAIEDSWKVVREGNIEACETSIADEKTSQVQAEGGMMLFDAKKENIAIQLETAYRERLVQAHSEVKKRLDYQLEVSNVKTRCEQEHMVTWIVDSVTKAITPAQEAAIMKKCFTDLKALAV